LYQKDIHGPQEKSGQNVLQRTQLNDELPLQQSPSVEISQVYRPFQQNTGCNAGRKWPILKDANIVYSNFEGM
jgi:hypothetical protein